MAESVHQESDSPSSPRTRAEKHNSSKHPLSLGSKSMLGVKERSSGAECQLVRADRCSLRFASFWSQMDPRMLLFLPSHCTEEPRVLLPPLIALKSQQELSLLGRDSGGSRSESSLPSNCAPPQSEEFWSQ